MSDVLLIIAQDRGSDPELVAPGFGAFLTFFALALACVILAFSMTRRVRRSQYRNAERNREAEAASGEPGSDAEASAAADHVGPDGVAAGPDREAVAGGGAAAEDAISPPADQGPDPRPAPGDEDAAGDGGDQTDVQHRGV